MSVCPELPTDAEALDGRLLFAIPKQGLIHMLDSFFLCPIGRLHEKLLELLLGLSYPRTVKHNDLAISSLFISNFKAQIFNFEDTTD
jgi:hypothetical protein